jgi:CheY-like chemotaxis protein
LTLVSASTENQDHRTAWGDERMNIFISYQRDDSPDASGRLKALVSSDARVQRVFFDRTSIPAGRKWPEVIAKEIGTAHVLLAVIGPRFDVKRLDAQAEGLRWELVTGHRLGKLFVPTLVNDARLPAKVALPDELRWLVDWQTFEVHPSTFDRDVGYLLDDLSKLEGGQPDDVPIALDPETPTLRLRPQPARSEYWGLWVDDHPDNNERERGVLEDFGVRFDLAISTSEAMRKLARRPYDIVVSDMARSSRSESDRSAGLTLIEGMRAKGFSTPVVIYGAASAVRRRDEVMSRGGQGSTASPFELYELVRRHVAGARPNPASG